MLVTIIAEQGAMGLIPYVLVYVLVLLRSFRTYRALPEKGLISKDYVVCVWCAIAAYVANAMFLEMRYFEYVNVLFFFLIGAMVGMQETMEADRKEKAATEEAPRGIWSRQPAASGGAR
jgi:O-antigen ligase